MNKLHARPLKPSKPSPWSPPPTRPTHTSTSANGPHPDPLRRLFKLITTSPTAGGSLELTLDSHCPHVTPDLAEQLLARLDNAGMLAYRFFEWARRRPSFPGHSLRAHHSVLAALAKIRQYRLVWDLVARMRRDRTLSVETFALLMRRYARAQKVEEALYTFNVMDKFGVEPNLAAFNSLLSALCKSKNVRKAQEVFDEMSHRFVPDAKTYSILLEGWGRAPNLPKMRVAYQEMIDSQCSPDIVTYGIMVDALCKAGRVEEAVDVVKEMNVRNCPPTSFIYSVLVHTYGMERRIEDAMETFLEMERNGVRPDVAVYNALITAFCKAGRFKNAFGVLEEMEDKGILPNSRTCNIMINVFIRVGKDDEAYRVFRWMIKRCEPDSDTYTMMIKLFFEEDRLEMALKVWKYMGKKQFVPSMHTFSVMINGLCKKGEVSKACEFLEEMIEKGIRPPGTTFGKLRHLLLNEKREDVLEFLEEKIKILVKEPLCE